MKDYDGTYKSDKYDGYDGEYKKDKYDGKKGKDDYKSKDGKNKKCGSDTDGKYGKQKREYSESCMSDDEEGYENKGKDDYKIPYQTKYH